MEVALGPRWRIPAFRAIDFAAPTFAAVTAVVAVMARLRGVDLPAQLYRVGLFHRSGLTLWNSQWYGGHWTFNYSVLFAPVAGVLGVQVTEIASAALAAWAFDRLVVDRFGPRASVGSTVFAVGTTAQIVVGQVPFLLGEAFGMTAFLAVRERRWVAAALLALAAALTSPLAAGFLALAVVARSLATWPRDRAWLALIAAASVAPAIALSMAFPGPGPMPFPAVDFLRLAAALTPACLLLPRRERGLRIAASLYLAATIISFLVASPVGENIARLGECVAAPLAVCAIANTRATRLALVAIIPLFAVQWTPAIESAAASPRGPVATAAYYQPLLHFLDAHRQPLGRTEIVPTRGHWEAALAAPHTPLARGWERQLDTSTNPIFYKTGALTSASYRRWLLDDGVRYVALPDVPLDYAAVAEGRLVERGVAGLEPAWHNAHWRVFAVLDSNGIVDRPARLLEASGDSVIVDAPRAGALVIRVRYTSHWDVTAGQGCVAATPDGWTQLVAARPGVFHLGLRLRGNQRCAK